MTRPLLSRLKPGSFSLRKTFSILLRKRNDNRPDAATFNTAETALRREVIASPDMGFLATDESAVLAALLRYARSASPVTSTCVLIAADQR